MIILYAIFKTRKKLFLRIVVVVSKKNPRYKDHLKQHYSRKEIQFLSIGEFHTKTIANDK